MKKILPFILAFLTLQAQAQLQRVVNIDFSKESFWQSKLSNYEKPAGTNYSFYSFAGFNTDILSFSFTKAAAGYNKDNDEFLLNLQQGATMTISVPTGSVLNSIVFDPSTVEADLSLAAGEPGSYDHSTKTWTSSGAVNQVKFSNFTLSSYIWKMKVTYTEPSVVLSAYASPSASETPVSFSSLILTYPNASGNMSVQSTSGITIQGDYADTSKGSVNTTMSASASGNRITLTVTPAIVSDGTFTINVPARAFRDGAGYENEAMTTTVTVRENRATFDTTAVVVQKSAEEYTSLNHCDIYTFPEEIILEFPTNIGHLDTETKFRLFREGTSDPVAQMKLAPVEGENKKAKLVFHSKSEDTFAKGVYHITVDQKVIYNSNYEDALYERYNPEFALTFNYKEAPDPLKGKKDEVAALKTEAAELYAKINTLGYPKADDTTHPLSDVKDQAVATTEDALDTQISNLKAAIKAFYDATDVVLPTAEKWYTISSVNSENTEIPLSYSDGAVKLGGTPAAFQVESISNGVAVLKVKAGKNSENQTIYKYLHVMLGADTYQMTSSKNITDSKTTVNNLNLAKLTIGTVGSDDQKPCAGLLTIKGILGLDTNLSPVDPAFALVDNFMSTPLFATSLADKDNCYFTATKTSAFRFVETTEPSDEPVTPPTPPTAINPTADLTDVNYTNNTMTLSIGEVTKVTLKDATLVKVLQDGTRDMSLSLTAPTLIEPMEGSNLQFIIHVDGLPVGNYTLSLPVGTFQYYDDGVNEQPLAPTFSITDGGSTPNPNPNPNPNPGTDIPTGNFQYNYMSGVYPGTVYGMYHTDESLNEFTIYTNQYNDLVADPRRIVKLTDNGNLDHVYRTGTLVEYTDEDYAKHPEWPAGTKALKLVMNAPINKGDLPSGHYAFVFEPATFGDANFRTWLADNSFQGLCVVNSRFAYDYIINNDAADANSTFTSYQTEQIAVVEGKAKEGDSQACADLIATAKSEIGFLRYDPEMTLAQNKARVDAIVSKLDSDLAAQRTSDANDAAFITYKSEQKTAVDGKVKEGDSEECAALITAAKAAIDALSYDTTKSLDANKELVDAIIAKLDADLAVQRDIDASKAALSKSVADATAYYESIKESHAAIASSLNSAIEAAKTILSNASSAKSVLDSTKQILDAALQNAKNAVATGITTISADDDAFNGVSIFTIDGRKLDGKPTKKGVYIVNGRKVVIK